MSSDGAAMPAAMHRIACFFVLAAVVFALMGGFAAGHLLVNTGVPL